MRICMIAPYFSFKEGEVTGGGVPHAVYYLSEALAALGNEVSVLCQAGEGGEVPKSLGFRVLRGRGSFGGTMMSLPVRDEFDVYHAHFSKGIRMELASMAFRRKSKVAAHVHYTPSKRVGLISRSRCFYRLANVVITPSAQNRARLVQSHSLAKNRVKVLPNGVDCSKFRYSSDLADSTKAQLGVEGKRVVLFVGHYAAPSKGTIFMVTAARKVVSEFPDTVFLFVGHGPEDKVEHDYMERVESLVGGSNLRGNVRFLETIPHSRLPAVYSAADVFVQPSLRESFGMPAVEAMACSRPVVVTSVGAAPEAIESGVNGYLVKPGDADGIANCVIRILESGQSSRIIGQRARETASARFAWESVAANLLGIYAAS